MEEEKDEIKTLKRKHANNVKVLPIAIKTHDRLFGGLEGVGVGSGWGGGGQDWMRRLKEDLGRG